MSDTGFVSHCLELLSPLGRTSSRRMFGGRALYIDDLCMALIFADALYLKVDDASREAFERAGCKPFIYATKNDEIHSLGYYTAPEEAMESAAEMLPWARRALAVAIAKRAKAPPAKQKPAARVLVKKVAAPMSAASKVSTEKGVAKSVRAKTAAVKPVARKAASKPAARKTAKP